MKKRKSEEDGGVQRGRVTTTPDVTTFKMSNQSLKVGGSSQGEINSASKNTENTKTEASPLIGNEAELPKVKMAGSDQEWDKEPVLMADSDDEKLIIDDSGLLVESPKNQSEPQTTTCPADSPVTSPSESTPANTDSSPPSRGTRSKGRRTKAPGDQLGEILRMQTAMFKSSSEPAAAVKSPGRCVGPQPNPHPTSLVKPCVSSYLERHQKEEDEIGALPPESALVKINPTEHKS